jgi:cysteine desulfurase
VYLDNNATTRPAPDVVEAVRGALVEHWHNPSSVHRPGQAARHKVELARKAVAELIGARPREITFTSGGTEAIDLAIRGTLVATKKRVIVTTAVEHAAVRDLCEALKVEGGVEARLAALDREGIVRVDSAESLLDERVGIVSIQWANNETGAIQPVEEIGRACRKRGIVFHVDGTQWVGKMPVGGVGGIEEWADLLTFAAHKFHGPKGVGVLWARSGVGLPARIRGVQEKGRRGGTENVPGIVGAGVAAELSRRWLEDAGERERLAWLRDRFEGAVLAAIPEARINGPRDPRKRLWNTTNIGFPRLEAEAILLLLSESGVCASAGAACSSGSLDPSPVLLAMGVPPEVAHGSIRFSLSRDTTEGEIEEAIGTVVRCVRKLAMGLPAL